MMIVHSDQPELPQVALSVVGDASLDDGGEGADTGLA